MNGFMPWSPIGNFFVLGASMSMEGQPIASTGVLCQLGSTEHGDEARLEGTIAMEG